MGTLTCSRRHFVDENMSTQLFSAADPHHFYTQNIGTYTDECAEGPASKISAMHSTYYNFVTSAATPHGQLWVSQNYTGYCPMSNEVGYNYNRTVQWNKGAGSSQNKGWSS